MRAPVAIISFTFFVRELLVESFLNSEIFTEIWRELIIATGARATPIIANSPLKTNNKPLGTPESFSIALYYRYSLMAYAFPVSQGSALSPQAQLKAPLKLGYGKILLEACC